MYFIARKPLHHLQVCQNKSGRSLDNLFPTINRLHSRAENDKTHGVFYTNPSYL